MKGLINYLRGTVELTVTGPFPERLINLCAQHRIPFWGVEWPEEHTLRLITSRPSLARLEELAGRVGCTVQVEARRGLPDFLLRFRARYAFLVGLTLSLCAAGVLSRFVMTIEVTGNQRIPTAVILAQLRQQGVRPGVYGPAIDRGQAAQEARLAIDGVAWMGINLHGTRLEVIVRETVPQPERIDETQWYDVVAETDGIVTHIEAELGDMAVGEGDTVAAGDVLISGTVTMEPPQYSDLPARYYQTHARGRVWARTWRTLEGVIPLEAEVKTESGEGKTRWTILCPGGQLVLWGGGPAQPGWSVEREVYALTLPGGFQLPFFLVRESAGAGEVQTVPVNMTAAQTLLEDHLEGRLTQLIGEEGTVEERRFEARVEKGLLRVTLHAQCLEEIGREQPGRPLAG